MTVADRISEIAAGRMEPAQLGKYQRHIADCAECSDALRGAEALASVKSREFTGPRAGLFEQVMAAAAGQADRRHPVRPFFWLGTGLGGAIAASLFALALALGWVVLPETSGSGPAQFVVARGEPRTMDVAIETDRPLANAEISILMSGGVELDGYGHRRELAWTTDLVAGVNRLSLPVVAVDESGGRMIVRLTHPRSEQVFVIRLATKA